MVSVQAASTGQTTAAIETGTPGAHRSVDIRRMGDHAVVRFEAAVDVALRHAAHAQRGSEPRFATRLLVVQLVLGRAIANAPLKLGR